MDSSFVALRRLSAARLTEGRDMWHNSFVICPCVNRLWLFFCAKGGIVAIILLMTTLSEQNSSSEIAIVGCPSADPCVGLAI